MNGPALFNTACVVSICFTIITLIETDQQWRLQISFERHRLQDGVEPGLLDDTNKVVSYTGVAVPKMPSQDTYSILKYFKVKEERINPHDYKFITSNRNKCNGEQPLLLLLCLSKYSDITTRNVIRRTWASVVTSGKWPMTNETFTQVKLVFLLGRSDVDNLTISDEISAFKDIVMIDFHDSYDNLTRKVLMGFKWVARFCPNAKYVLKVDQDTFVHIPNLISYLKNISLPKTGLVAGRVNYRSVVLREGRWNLTWNEFPFEYYPPYLSGNTYITSGNALRRMIWVAERMPYLKIEDVFFSGIVRRIVQAEIHNRPGFTHFNESSPALCSFHNNVRISATNTDDDRKVQLWQALHTNLTNCYAPPLRRGNSKLPQRR